MTPLHMVSDAPPTRFVPVRALCGALVSTRELAPNVDKVTCPKCLARMAAREAAEV